METRIALANDVTFTLEPGTLDAFIGDGVLSISEAPGQNGTISLASIESLPADQDLAIEALSISFADNISSFLFPTGPDNTVTLTTNFLGGTDITTDSDFTGVFSAGAPINFSAGTDIDFGGLFNSGIDSTIEAGLQGLGGIDFENLFGGDVGLSATGDITLKNVFANNLTAISHAGSISDSANADLFVANDIGLFAQGGDIDVGEQETDATSILGTISAQAQNVVVYNDQPVDLSFLQATVSTKVVSEGDLSSSVTSLVEAPDATFIARNGDILLPLIQVDTVSLDSTGSVTVQDPDSFDFGNVFVEGDLAGTASNAIGSGGSQLAVFGETDLAAGATIDLSDIDGSKLQVFGEKVSLTAPDASLSAESFTGFETLQVEGNGDNLTIDAAGNVVLGNTTLTGDLSVNSGGTITDSAPNVIGGSTSLTANVSDEFFDIQLDELGNDFNQVDATGDNISLVDANAVVLGAITANDDLNVSTGGSITDTPGESIQVAGVTSLSALDSGTGDLFDIALDNAGTHNFDSDNSGDGFFSQGNDLTVTDVDNLVLGELTLTGEFDADIDGDILQVPDTAITVAGQTTLTAGGDILLDEIGNDFDSDGGANPTDSVGVGGGRIFIADQTGILFGELTAGGDLTVTSGGSIKDTPGESIQVAGVTSLSALDSGTGDLFDIALDNAGTHNFDSDNSGDGFFSQGNDLTVTDVDNLVLGELTLTGEFDADIDGDILQVPDTAITVAGQTTLTAGGDILLDEIGNDFDSDGGANPTDSVGVGGGRIFIADQTGILFGELTAGGDLTVTSGGSIKDTPGESIQVAGVTSLSALDSGTGDLFDIALDNAGTHNFDSDNSGDGFFSQGNDLTVTDVDNLVLGELTLTGEFDADIDGDILQVPDTAITVAGQTTLTAGGDILLDQIGNDFDSDGGANPTDSVGVGGGRIFIADQTGILFGELTAGGDLTVTSGGSIKDTPGESIQVAGVTSLSALDSGTGDLFDIALDNAGTHNFDSDNSGDGFFSQGNDLTVTDVDNLVLGELTLTGEFDADIDGDILQVPDTSITVAGQTTLTAGGDILLDEIGNDFDSDGGANPTDSVGVGGGRIFIADQTGILFGELTAGGDLTVTSGGSIKDTPGESIQVAGVTSLSALDSGTGDLFDIALDNAGTHNFDSDNSGDGFFSQGNDLTVTDVDNLVLGELTLTGEFDADIDGDILQVPDTSITVAGQTTLTAGGDILLDEIGNDFDSDGGANPTDSVGVGGGRIFIADQTGILFGELTAGGDLTVTSGGSIKDTPGESIQVAGVTSLSALDSGTGDLFDIALDNAGTHNFDSDNSGDGFFSQGNDLTVTDVDNLVLGELTLTGEFDADIDGDILQVPDTSITVAGQTTLTAGGDILFNELGNDFTGDVSAQSASIALTTNETLELNTLETTGSAVFNAQSFRTDEDSTITAGTVSVFLSESRSPGSAVVLSDWDVPGGVDINGHDQADTFFVTPSSTTEFDIDGGDPLGVLGDQLTVNVLGAPGAVIANPGGFAAPNGVVQFQEPHRDIRFNNVEVIRDNGPPHVIDVLISGASWNVTEDFGAFSIFNHDLCVPLPWQNADVVEIVFDRDVVLDIDSTSVFGAEAGEYNFLPDDPTDTLPDDGFRYDSATFTATYRFDRFLKNDRFTLTIEGEEVDTSPVVGAVSGLLLNGGDDEVVSFDVLPGDVNGDRQVDTTDVLAVRPLMSSKQFASNYDPFFDPNHDGFIGLTDLIAVAGSRGTSLPGCGGDSSEISLPRGGGGFFGKGDSNSKSSDSSKPQEGQGKADFIDQANFQYVASASHMMHDVSEQREQRIAFSRELLGRDTAENQIQRASTTSIAAEISDQPRIGSVTTVQTPHFALSQKQAGTGLAQKLTGEYLVMGWSGHFRSWR